MRWKNRTIKLVVDIPATCKDDEDFANDLAETLDSNDWYIGVQRKGKKIPVQVNKAIVGEIEIEKE